MRRVLPNLSWWSRSFFLSVLRHDGGECADEKAGGYTAPEHDECEHHRISHGAGLRAMTVRRGDGWLRTYILNMRCALRRRFCVRNRLTVTATLVMAEMMRMAVICSPFLFLGRRLGAS